MFVKGEIEKWRNETLGIHTYYENYENMDRQRTLEN